MLKYLYPDEDNKLVVDYHDVIQRSPQYSRGWQLMLVLLDDEGTDFASSVNTLNYDLGDGRWDSNNWDSYKFVLVNTNEVSY